MLYDIAKLLLLNVLCLVSRVFINKLSSSLAELVSFILSSGTAQISNGNTQISYGTAQISSKTARKVSKWIKLYQFQFWDGFYNIWACQDEYC